MNTITTTLYLLKSTKTTHVYGSDPTGTADVSPIRSAVYFEKRAVGETAPKRIQGVFTPLED